MKAMTGTARVCTASAARSVRAAALRRVVALAVALFALWALSAPLLAASYDIEVNKKKRVLTVREGDRVRATFPIALGRGGPGDKRKLGDKKTPVGTYRIVGVDNGTAFDTFLRLN